MEGEISITLEYLKDDSSIVNNFGSFYHTLYPHLLKLNRLDWHQLQKQRFNRQQQFKYHYHKKYSTSEAFQIFKDLKCQIEQL